MEGLTPPKRPPRRAARRIPVLDLNPEPAVRLPDNEIELRAMVAAMDRRELVWGFVMGRLLQEYVNERWTALAQHLA